MEITSGTFFSSVDDIQSEILKVLDSARKEIKVAVAWFTNRTLFNKLLEKQAEGVNVYVIIASHEINRNCGINYDMLATAGGEFLELVNEDGLMHSKFCVVDFNIICMGSYNWTYSANKRNQETMDITVGDLKKVDGFLQEFERMRNLCGQQVEYSTPDLSETLQIFQLVKAFINLNQPHMITPYLNQLQKVDEIRHIVEYLKSQEYDKAIRSIDQFMHDYTRPVSVTQREIAALKFKIQYFSYQVESLEAEKTQTESELEQFTHRYVIELNPIILKILELKKKLYRKLKEYGIVDSTYEDLEEEFRQAQESLQEEAEIEIPDLNLDDLKTIKQLHREGVAMSHPDSPGCIYEDKKQASHMFDQLTKAYKANDIEKVKFLVGEMRLGKTANETDNYNELDYLKAKLVSLEQKYKILLVELVEIKSSEYYQKMPPREEWNLYFERAKLQLQLDYTHLEEKYTHAKTN